MKLSYEAWAQAKLHEKGRCKVEKNLSCVPLRGDPLCRACYETAREAEKQKRAEHTPPGEVCV